MNQKHIEKVQNYCFKYNQLGKGKSNNTNKISPHTKESGMYHKKNKDNQFGHE